MKKRLALLAVFATFLYAETDCNKCTSKTAMDCLKESSPDAYKDLLKKIKTDSTTYLLNFKHNKVEDKDVVLLKKKGGTIALKHDVKEIECLQKIDNYTISWNEQEEDYELKETSEKERQAYLKKIKSKATHQKVEKVEDDHVEEHHAFETKPDFVNGGTVRDFVSEAMLTDRSTIEKPH